MFTFLLFTPFSFIRKRRKRLAKQIRSVGVRLKKLTLTGQMAAPKFVIHSRNVLNFPPVQVTNHDGLMGWWFQRQESLFSGKWTVTTISFSP